MSKRRRGLASLLSAMMLLSMLPVSALAEETPLNSGVSPGGQTIQSSQEGSSAQVPGTEQDNSYDIDLQSLLPLEEHRATIDLTGYFPEELEAFPVSTVLEKLVMQDSYQIPADAKIVYATSPYLYSEDMNDDYTIINDRATDTMDLCPEDDYRSTIFLEMIVGQVDQLNGENVRIIATVYITPAQQIFDFKAATDAEPRQEIEIYSTGSGTSNNRKAAYIWVSDANWKESEQANLSMSLSDPWASQEDLETQVYAGYFTSQEELSDANEITDQVYDVADITQEGGYLAAYGDDEDPPSFTVVFSRGDEIVSIRPFVVRMMVDSTDVQLQGLYKNEDDSRVRVAYSRDYHWDNGVKIYTYMLEDSDDPADGTYYISAELYNPADQNADDNGIVYVERAVVGDFDTAEEIEAQNDIKEQLFSNANQPDGGYGADFSQGITFSVLDTYGNIHCFKVIVELGEEELPNAPTPLSADTYFRMEGALSQANGTYSDRYNAYVMPFGDDSYYYNGYQTVFLLGSDGEAISDNTAIYPNFYTGSKVEAFLGLDVDGQTESGRKQTSGESEIIFQNGEAMEYSAAAENGRHLKNYWVTFLTRQAGGPALFVNGINDEDRFDETENLPVREVFLTEEYDYHHDIFFANIGDAAMTGLTVTLEDAQNVALDAYWTVGETKTLQAFASTDKTETYGELANVAKIRLVRATNENGEPMAGEVSGKITIKADGIDPVTILLKGTAGIPKITTDTVWDGVLYVPYSSVIQTNNMYASDAIEFTLASGRLPAGITLKPNGEIYGVPRETGDFTFTVAATYEGQPMEPKTFTLHIASNTNTNVWDYDQMIWADDKYQINIAIPNEDGTVNSPTGSWEIATNSWNNPNMMFESDGEIAYFVDVWLDGDKLDSDSDYDAEEGSTKITIRTQTLASKGNGTHTIAAEFRDNAGNLRRTAQNYTLTTKGDNGGSGSNPGGGDHSSGNSNTGTTPPPSYEISVPQRTEHGSVSISPKQAKQGDTVTLTVQPDPGYQLGSLIVTDKNGQSVALVNRGNGKYQFTMPKSKVDIQVTFNPISNPIDEFIDVSADLYYADAVRWAVQEGITSGISANVFGPDVSCSRGQIIMFLWRATGSPEPSGTVNPFVDLDHNAYYYDAILWAAENGITGGTTPNTCEPNAACTRAQVMALLWRASGSPEIQGSSNFIDVSPDAYYADAVAWAEQNGITSGIGDGQFGTDQVCSRAQVMMFLYQRAKNK